MIFNSITNTQHFCIQIQLQIRFLTTEGFDLCCHLVSDTEQMSYFCYLGAGLGLNTHVSLLGRCDL